MWKTWTQINKNWLKENSLRDEKNLSKGSLYGQLYKSTLSINPFCLWSLLIQSVLYSSLLANMRGSMKSFEKEFGKFHKSLNNLKDQAKLFQPQYTLLNLVWKYLQINCKKLHLTNTVFWCWIYLSYMSGVHMPTCRFSL
jgi:hypothetical protein